MKFVLCAEIAVWTLQSDSFFGILFMNLGHLFMYLGQEGHMVGSLLHGNAIVGQSGGPTAAINASLAGVIDAAMKADEIGKIYGAGGGIDGILSRKITDLGAQFKDDKKLDLLCATPAAALGSCRKKLPDPHTEDAIYEEIFRIFGEYDIRYFFYIGGNDSMDTVSKLSIYAQRHGYDMRFMGVPKTIDNDVMGSDHTPGFGSAAKYVAASVQEILRDCAVYTIPAVTIVEIMGRDAGWLTAAAGISARYHGVAPDYIYLPERAFSFDTFFHDIERAFEHHPNVVIAVSEGLRLADGRYVGEGDQSGVTDVFGHKYLAGTAKTLEHAVRAKFGCKVRSVEINILQRCASHMASLTDITEARAVGAAAVNAALKGESGRMMAFSRVSDAPYRVKIDSVDVSVAANAVRTVPVTYINAAGNGITDACIDYILPLCEGELSVPYAHGLPMHCVIDKTPVSPEND